MNFQPRDSHSSCLFKFNHILKFLPNLKVGNVLLISKSIKKLLPTYSDGWFTFCFDIHKYQKNAITVGAINF